MAEIHVNKVKRENKVALTGKPITVGRASENDLVLRSKSVSRHHCVIEVVDGAAQIRDLGSRHGTKINGRTIESDAPLEPGDRITVGSYEITYDDGALRSDSNGTSTAAPRSKAVDPDPGDSDAPVAALELAEKIDRLDHDRAALDRAAHDLKTQRHALATEAAAFASRRQAFEQQEAALGDLRQALDQERDALASARDELATSRARHAEEIEKLTAERQAAEQQAESRATRARELEAELTDVRDQLARERDAAEAARRTVVAAEARVEAAVESQKDAADSAAEVDRLVRKLEQGVELLRSAALRLRTTLETVQEIEQVWIEVDERINELESQDRLDQAHLRERDQLSTHLEDAHEARDAAMIDLIEVAGRLEVVLQQHNR